MTIEIIKGCLLDAFDRGEVEVIGHIVNCQGKMNSGIAKSIRERYPDVYDRYKAMSDRIEPQRLLGYSQFVFTDMEPDKGVYNLFAQLNYGALSDCLVYVKDYCFNNCHPIVGLPYLMGCDRAGGDWSIVLEMIEYYFKGLYVKIYKLEK